MITPLRARRRMRGLDRQIFALAVPALGALIAEPIFLATDSAMVGHLGAEFLAGLAVAGLVLNTIIGLMIFLAYSTTPLVARNVGAGRLQDALAVGGSSIVVAAVLGIILTAAGWMFGDYFISLMTDDVAVTVAAQTYLHISIAGIPAMLIVFAATGLMRGFQDTVTPLIVSGGGFALNIVLNAILIYGFGLSIAGSAWGLVIVQWLMVVAFFWKISALKKAHNLSFRLSFADVFANITMGSWLFIRSITLRIALLMTVWFASHLGVHELAGYQIVFTLSSIAAFALDALAIAAQAMVGKSLGASDTRSARQILQRIIYWGFVCGAIIGVVIIAASSVIPYIFSSHPDVVSLSVWPLVVLGFSLPLAAYVYVLDGVLMGSGDVKYLAFAGVLAFIGFLPFIAIVWFADVGSTASLVLLTVAFHVGYLAARALTLGLRVRGDRWLHEELNEPKAVA